MIQHCSVWTKSIETLEWGADQAERLRLCSQSRPQQPFCSQTKTLLNMKTQERKGQERCVNLLEDQCATGMQFCSCKWYGDVIGNQWLFMWPTVTFQRKLVRLLLWLQGEYTHTHENKPDLTALRFNVKALKGWTSFVSPSPTVVIENMKGPLLT